MDLDGQAHKLIAGLVRVAVMAPSNAPVPDGDRPPVQRQVMLLLSRRERDYRLTELAAELGSTVPATMSVVSPLIAAGLVQMRPAASYAARDMCVSATERGLGLTPAPSNWADGLLAEVERLDEAERHRLLRVVTTRIAELQQEGRIPITRMCLSCRFFDAYRHAGDVAPHHCWFVDAPFGYRELRLHCPDHISAGSLRAIARLSPPEEPPDAPR